MMDWQLFFFYFEVEEKDETSLLASEYIVINMKPFYSSTKNYIPSEYIVINMKPFYSSTKNYIPSEYIVINMKPFYSSTKNYIPRIKACMVYLEQKKG